MNDKTISNTLCDAIITILRVNHFEIPDSEIIKGCNLFAIGFDSLMIGDLIVLLGDKLNIKDLDIECCEFTFDNIKVNILKRLRV